MIRARPGESTAARAAAWLGRWAKEQAAGSAPFFVWMHLFDAHQPYRAAVAERLPRPPPTTPRSGCSTAPSAASSTGSRGANVLDDTLVVVTADHGESLGEHGEKTHAVFIYDATVRVPLLLRCPRAAAQGKVFDGPVRSVDLVPTILAAVKLPPATRPRGRSPARPPRRRHAARPPQYSESLLSEVGFGMAPLYGVRHDGFKWIRAPEPEVYDLRTIRTSSATSTRPRPAAAPPSTASSQPFSTTAAAAPSPQKSPMDKETLESLQALGYLAPRTSREAMGGIDPKDGMPLYTELEDARHLAQQDKWAESEKLLRQLLATTPNNVTAVNILALVRPARGISPRRAPSTCAPSPSTPSRRACTPCWAPSACSTTTSTRPSAPTGGRSRSARLRRGARQPRHGRRPARRPAEAETWYRKAIAADPGFPRVYRRLADLYYERGDFAQALADYRKTLAAEPKDFDALVQAGQLGAPVRRPTDRRRLFSPAPPTCARTPGCRSTTTPVWRRSPATRSRP